MNILTSFFYLNSNGIKRKQKIEIIVFIFFVIASIVIAFFHEPWFDEAQAWAIAKTASYKDILFTLPHYEGHPALWTLILSIPAKIGVPYEIGLKTVGLLISTANAFLIIFKSPFPKIVRLLLPFNFFLFYQYGIVARPYGLIVLLLLILAILFPSKDKHPWKFTIVLMLLCFTHAYGVMIAAGIAICIVWDLLKEKGFKKFARNLFSDHRIIALEALLIVAVLVIIEIFPEKNTIGAFTEASNSLISRCLCMLFTMIPDCLIFKSEWFSMDPSFLKDSNISAAGLISACIVGLIVWCIIWLLGSRKNFKYLFIPYIFFAIFGAVVYMVSHHIGVSLGLLIFWLWIDIKDPEKLENWYKLRNKLNSNPFDSKIVRFGLMILVGICLIMPIYWSATSSINDISEEYSYGRNMAAYIKEHNLENLNIYVSWDSSLLENNNENEDNETIFVASDPTLLNYFDKNILNNVQNKNQFYRMFKANSPEEAKNIAAEWEKKDIPDIIIGTPDLESVYGKDGPILNDYTIVYLGYYNYCYKDEMSVGTLPIYARNDIVAKYGLEEVDTSDVLLHNYNLTDEMIEAYNNGEITLDDILDMTIGDFGKN